MKKRVEVPPSPASTPRPPNSPLSIKVGLRKEKLDPDPAPEENFHPKPRITPRDRLPGHLIQTQLAIQPPNVMTEKTAVLYLTTRVGHTVILQVHNHHRNALVN